MYYKSIICALLEFAESHEYIVRFKELKMNNARIKGRRIAIRQGMSEREILEALAHEVSHAFLHYDKGDIINSAKREEYEEQAERCTDLITELLQFVISNRNIMRNHQSPADLLSYPEWMIRK